MLHIKYSEEIEQLMKAFFETLNEKGRRRYTAIEAIKLGHGGQKGSGAKIHKTEFIRNPNELLEHLSSKFVTNIKVFHRDV